MNTRLARRVAQPRCDGRADQRREEWDPGTGSAGPPGLRDTMRKLSPEDPGGQMTRHAELAAIIGVPVDLTDAYRSWQRRKASSERARRPSAFVALAPFLQI
jgi:hypothetical protein